jgi:acyl-CoA thioester hydrolase
MIEPFGAEQRVLYGDTDAMGVAYYANYLKWFEIGRTELFRRVGSTYRSLEESGCFLPVYESYCRYHNPARYDDIIHIETTFSLPGKARLRFDYRLFHKQNRTLLAEGYTVHVCTDRDGRVLKPPAGLRRLLKQMEEVSAGSPSTGSGPGAVRSMR